MAWVEAVFGMVPYYGHSNWHGMDPVQLKYKRSYHTLMNLDFGSLVFGLNYWVKIINKTSPKRPLPGWFVQDDNSAFLFVFAELARSRKGAQESRLSTSEPFSSRLEVLQRDRVKLQEHEPEHSIPSLLPFFAEGTKRILHHSGRENSREFQANVLHKQIRPGKR